MANQQKAKSADILDALPRLGPDDLIPEINGLMIDANGNLMPRQRKQQYIVTFDYKSRRITARFAGGRDEPIQMELGCRLMRLPYSAECREKRRGLIERVQTAQERHPPAQLTVTHHQWLYAREKLLLEPAKLTASWLINQLTIAALCMRPLILLFNEEPIRT